MYPTTRVFLKDDNGDKFFGEGPCRLLEGIERTGSLRAASQEMQMAYTKALHLLRHAEETLGFPLTERTIGGKGGGGSRLTAGARDFVEKYKTYRDACYQANLEIYREVFGEEGQLKEAHPRLACVLMASGLGQRFGGNKLLAPFHGEPLICRILKATDSPLFSRRVVVTRYPEIAALCEKMGIQTVLHSLPYRSDTVRLGVEAVCGSQRADVDFHAVNGSSINCILPGDAPDIPGDCLTTSCISPGDASDISDGRLSDGCMFCACDQPLLSRETIERMARAFLAEPQFIYRLAYKDTPGNPIIFPKEHFPALKDLPPDKGGAYVAKSFPQQVRLVEAASAMELKDIDTAEDLAFLEEIISA